MDSVTIYHNPRCSKSRQTLALLRERGVEPTVVEYLRTPLDEAGIAQLLQKLGISAAELIRKKEARELGLSEACDEKTLIASMAAHPEIIERPIVVVGNRARLGRPPQRVLEMLQDELA